MMTSRLAVFALLALFALFARVIGLRGVVRVPSFLILRHHHDWLAIYVFKTRVKARAKAEREGGVNGVMGHGPWARMSGHAC